MRRSLWIVCLVLFCFASVLSGRSLRKDFRKRLDFVSGGQVIVDNTSGTISALSWSDNAVEILADIEVKAGSQREAEAFLEKVEIRVDASSDRIMVEADYPKRRDDGNILDWIFGRRKPRVKIDYLIRVPRRTDLDLKSVNGPISVLDITGQVVLHSTNGRIESEGVCGSVRAKTVNGGISIDLEELDSVNQTSAKTTNGSIRISLPGDVKVDLEASTVNGSVSTDLPLTIQGNWHKKRISGQMNGGGARMTLRTVNGSIRIHER